MRRPVDQIAALVRVRVADGVRRALLGPLAGDLPARSIRSLQEHAFRADVSAHRPRSHVWRRATVATYTEPPAFGPGFRDVKAFDERHVWELDDVVVSPRTGLVWLPDGVVLEEGVGALRRLIGWGDVRPELLRRPRALPTAAPVIACPPVPFFHWLLEVLPGVIAGLRAVPGARVLLHDPSPAYVREGLGWLQDTGLLQTPPLVASRPVRVRRSILPAAEVFSGFVHPDDLADLRATLLPSATGEVAASGRPLYVSRRRASARPLAGEEAAERQLAAAGLHVTVLEAHDLRSQARLMAAAPVVVAPHGAGLANLVWCRPGTAVVEVFPHGFRNDCYARMASDLRLPYRCVEADPAGGVDVARVLAAVEEVAGGLPPAAG